MTMHSTLWFFLTILDAHPLLPQSKFPFMPAENSVQDSYDNNRTLWEQDPPVNIQKFSLDLQVFTGITIQC